MAIVQQSLLLAKLITHNKRLLQNDRFKIGTQIFILRGVFFHEIIIVSLPINLSSLIVPSFPVLSSNLKSLYLKPVAKSIYCFQRHLVESRLILMIIAAKRRSKLRI